MNTQEFYNFIQSDYQNILHRFQKESRIVRFLKKFEQDPSYFLLQKALEQKDHQQAFIAAHSLKGLAQNLSLDPLYESAARITELLRNGWDESALEHFEELSGIYQQCVAGIQELS